MDVVVAVLMIRRIAMQEGGSRKWPRVHAGEAEVSTVATKSSVRTTVQLGWSAMSYCPMGCSSLSSIV
jgi:hypothetical protein